MPKRKNLKPIPKFESEDEEREFWANYDSTDYVDWSRAKPTTFPRLKPTTQTISLRLPEFLLGERFAAPEIHQRVLELDKQSQIVLDSADKDRTLVV